MESIGLESPDDHNLSQIWSTFERSSGSVSIDKTQFLESRHQVLLPQTLVASSYRYGYQTLDVTYELIDASIEFRGTETTSLLGQSEPCLL